MFKLFLIINLCVQIVQGEAKTFEEKIDLLVKNLEAWWSYEKDYSTSPSNNPEKRADALRDYIEALEGNNQGLNGLLLPPPPPPPPPGLKVNERQVAEKFLRAGGMEFDLSIPQGKSEHFQVKAYSQYEGTMGEFLKNVSKQNDAFVMLYKEVFNELLERCRDFFEEFRKRRNLFWEAYKNEEYLKKLEALLQPEKEKAKKGEAVYKTVAQLEVREKRIILNAIRRLADSEDQKEIVVSFINGLWNNSLVVGGNKNLEQSFKTLFEFCKTLHFYLKQGRSWPKEVSGSNAKKYLEENLLPQDIKYKYDCFRAAMCDEAFLKSQKVTPIRENPFYKANEKFKSKSKDLFFQQMEELYFEQKYFNEEISKEFIQLGCYGMHLTVVDWLDKDSVDVAYKEIFPQGDIDEKDFFKEQKKDPALASFIDKIGSQKGYLNREALANDIQKILRLINEKRKTSVQKGFEWKLLLFQKYFSLPENKSIIDRDFKEIFGQDQTLENFDWKWYWETVVSEYDLTEEEKEILTIIKGLFSARGDKGITLRLAEDKLNNLTREDLKKQIVLFLKIQKNTLVPQKDFNINLIGVSDISKRFGISTEGTTTKQVKDVCKSVGKLSGILGKPEKLAVFFDDLPWIEKQKISSHMASIILEKKKKEKEELEAKRRAEEAKQKQSVLVQKDENGGNVARNEADKNSADGELEALRNENRSLRQQLKEKAREILELQQRWHQESEEHAGEMEGLLQKLKELGKEVKKPKSKHKKEKGKALDAKDAELEKLRAEKDAELAEKDAQLIAANKKLQDLMKENQALQSANQSLSNENATLKKRPIRGGGGGISTVYRENKEALNNMRDELEQVQGSLGAKDAELADKDEQIQSLINENSALRQKVKELENNKQRSKASSFLSEEELMAIDAQAKQLNEIKEEIAEDARALNQKADELKKREEKVKADEKALKLKKDKSVLNGEKLKAGAVKIGNDEDSVTSKQSSASKKKETTSVAPTKVTPIATPPVRSSAVQQPIVPMATPLKIQSPANKPVVEPSSNRAGDKLVTPTSNRLMLPVGAR
ncbi:MAG: hypothetical protein ACSW8C_01815 [bacterium]